MLQKTTVFIPLAIISLMLIVACQKQQEVTKPQPATPKAARVSLALNTASTKCRISVEDAVLYTKTFREHMEKVEGKKAGAYTIAYTIPAEGLLDLFTTAEQQGKKLKAIRTYRGIRDGHETLVYVGVDENDNDLIPNADDDIRNFNGSGLPMEDYAGGCPSGDCRIAPNVLTSK